MSSARENSNQPARALGSSNRVPPLGTSVSYRQRGATSSSSPVQVAKHGSGNGNGSVNGLLREKRLSYTNGGARATVIDGCRCTTSRLIRQPKRLGSTWLVQEKGSYCRGSTRLQRHGTRAPGERVELPWGNCQLVTQLQQEIAREGGSKTKLKERRYPAAKLSGLQWPLLITDG